MNTSHPDDREDEIDRPVARRLGELRRMPVDASRLNKLLRAQIAPPPTHFASRLFQIRPLRAAAASVALLAMLIAAFLATASGPALASMDQMARMHQDIVSGKTPVTQVDSIAAANRALSAESPLTPQLPSVPAEHVMACCMKNVKDKKVACVLLRDENIPVTLTVAKATDIRTPVSPITLRAGVAYHVQSFPVPTGVLNMVMTERNGRWICLIGQTSAERLMDLASKVSF